MMTTTTTPKRPWLDRLKHHLAAQSEEQYTPPNMSCSLTDKTDETPAVACSVGFVGEWVQAQTRETASPPSGAITTPPRPDSGSVAPAVSRLLPEFLTPHRRTVLDTVRRLQRRNGGRLVTFDEIASALTQKMTHTQVATALTAVVEGGYVSRVGRWRTLVWRYGVTPTPTSTSGDSTILDCPQAPSSLTDKTDRTVNEGGFVGFVGESDETHVHDHDASEWEVVLCPRQLSR